MFDDSTKKRLPSLIKIYRYRLSRVKDSLVSFPIDNRLICVFESRNPQFPPAELAHFLRPAIQIAFLRNPA